MERNQSPAITIRWVEQMSHVDPVAWDRLALPLETPFLEWEWLHQLEVSGSIVPENGWLPHHLTVWRDDRLVAAAPLYIKANSAGEFVFDHPWARVASRIGIQYYPKLVGMSPVTPVIGYRFLMASGVDEKRLTRAMAKEIDRFCAANRIAGCSFLFVDPAWGRCLAGLGYTGWLHQSYAWENPGFESFDDYLAVFNANQRRNIRRERRAMAKAGISLSALAADQIPADFIPLMYRFYESTNDRYGPWGCKYLTPEFFDGIYRHYRHRLVLLAASEAERLREPVAMAMLLFKEDRLYGRYWGCRRPLDALHFNTCYYSPIEWAIQKGIRRFDPGAGSTHKLRRGFKAVGNYSLHRFYDPRLAQIMAIHMDDINAAEQEQIDSLNASLPFSTENRVDGLRG
jgi:predicted N-acyltransferase